MSRVFRYYNPPEMLRQIGRALSAGRLSGAADKFAHLRGQLGDGEILIGLFENQNHALVAAHVGTAERLEELETAQGAVWEFYTVPIQVLNNRISKKEMKGSD